MPHYPDGLAQLKDRVISATRELDRLRTDNERMTDAIEEVWGDRRRSDSDLAIVIESDRDELRDKIRGYIATIDRYLEED